MVILSLKRSHSHIPKRDRTPTSQIAIASSHPKQRSHPNTPKAITHPLIHKQRLHPKSPKSDRTPTSSSSDRIPNIPNKRFLRSASLSHSHTPKAIAPSPHPQQAIPTERFAIASPHPKSDRTPHSQTRSHPQKRFLRSASLSHSHTPKQRFLRSASLSHSHTPKAIPTERFAIAFPTSPTSDRIDKLPKMATL